MSSDNRGNYYQQPPPIYTVSGAHPDNANYGFYTAPPPKYEDAVRGTPLEQPIPAQGGMQPAGVVFVSPAYKKSSNMMSSLFVLLIFLAFFIYIFIRMGA